MHFWGLPCAVGDAQPRALPWAALVSRTPQVGIKLTKANIEIIVKVAYLGDFESYAVYALLRR